MPSISIIQVLKWHWKPVGVRCDKSLISINHELEGDGKRSICIKYVKPRHPDQK